MKNRILSISLAVVLALSVGLIGCGGEPASEITEHNLAISSTEGGSVTNPGEQAYTYDEGEAVNLVAEPDEGYRFQNWSGDVDNMDDVNAASTTITMTDDYSITANFIAQCVLIIDSTAGGDVTSPGEGVFTYDAGVVVDLLTEAEEGYGFAKWTGDVDSITDVNGESTTITMNGDYEISANFGTGIYDWYDLDAVRGNLAGSYVLMNDLDSTSAGYAELASPAANQGRGWMPIGYGYWEGGEGWPDEDGGWVGEILEVAFYGRGHAIRDLFIDRPNEDNIGLFGRLSDGGIVEQLGVLNVEVSGHRHIGGLVGWNHGTVGDCYCSGNMDGDQFVGGLIGNAWTGTLSDSYFAGSVNGQENVGGLVGSIDCGTVSNSYYNHDEVLINGYNVVTIGALLAKDFEQWQANGKYLDVDEGLSQENGYYVISDVDDFKELLPFGQDASLRLSLRNDLDLGNDPNFFIPYLAGEFDGNGYEISGLSFTFDFVAHVGLFGYVAYGATVDHVSVTVTMITGSYTCGAVAGWNYGNVSNSYSAGNVAGNVHVGGLMGFHGGTVSSSYSVCSVTGSGTVGGLVGQNEGTVSNSYSTGVVTGGWCVGGLVGLNQKEGIVSNSYSTGSVGGDEHVGGLVGWSNGTVRNSLWDTQTSGQATSAGGTGKTTSQMKNIATFSGAGWNIVAVADPAIRNPSYVWNIVDGQTYPFLSWQAAS